MNFGVTFNGYYGNCQFVWRSPFTFKNTGFRAIFFGATKEELELSIKAYGSEEEKRSYFGEPKEEKYYKDLFEYMEDVK